MCTPWVVLSCRNVFFWAALHTKLHTAYPVSPNLMLSFPEFHTPPIFHHYHNNHSTNKNITNHPISSNSHPLETENKAIYILKMGGGWLHNQCEHHITLTKYEAVHPTAVCHRTSFTYGNIISFWQSMKKCIQWPMFEGDSKSSLSRHETMLEGNETRIETYKIHRDLLTFNW